MESNDIIAVGRGYLMVHAATDAKKTVNLPGVFNVSEIFGASADRKGVSVIKEHMKRGETRVWRMAK